MQENSLNYLQTFYRFLRDTYNSRSLLIDLAKNDFKSRYMGNYLGGSLGICTANRDDINLLVNFELLEEIEIN